MEWKDRSAGQGTMSERTTLEVLKVLNQFSGVPFHSPMSTSGGQEFTPCGEVGMMGQSRRKRRVRDTYGEPAKGTKGERWKRTRQRWEGRTHQKAGHVPLTVGALNSPDSV